MIKVLIQVAAGSRERYLYNEKTLELKGRTQMSRPFPYPYGFVIGTSAADGDCVDCYVISKDILKAGTIIECEPLGLLEQLEDGDIDHKVLAALPHEKVILDQDLLNEIRDFVAALIAPFPDVEINIGSILPREEAIRHIQEHKDGTN